MAQLLTDAKADKGLTWLDVEEATGIRKATREGWFRASTSNPPLGPVAYLADYLGIDADALIEAALVDYANAGTPEPATERDSRAIEEMHALDDRREVTTSRRKASKSRPRA